MARPRKTRNTDRCRLIRLRALLIKWIDRFGDYEDAGPRGETWQSDELAALIEASEAAAKDGVPEPENPGPDPEILRIDWKYEKGGA